MVASGRSEPVCMTCRVTALERAASQIIWMKGSRRPKGDNGKLPKRQLHLHIGFGEHRVYLVYLISLQPISPAKASITV